MGFGVPQLLGHHGNELHAFDELLGGKNRWGNLVSFRLWDMLAVRYVLLPTEMQQRMGGIPGYEPIVSGVRASSGILADLYERQDVQPYARFVTAAMRVEDEQAVAVIADPTSGFDPNGVVLLAMDAAVDRGWGSEFPDTAQVSVTVAVWEPGRMRLRLEPAAPGDGFVVVSENWYPDWRATADGVEAPVARANGSLIAVAVRAGTEIVELEFESADYRSGRLASLLSLALVAVGLVLPQVLRLRKTRV